MNPYRKTRADSVLGKLSEKDQGEIFQFLQDHKLIETQGFLAARYQLKVPLSSLSSWAKKRRILLNGEASLPSAEELALGQKSSEELRESMIDFWKTRISQLAQEAVNAMKRGDKAQADTLYHELRQAVKLHSQELQIKTRMQRTKIQEIKMKMAHYKQHFNPKRFAEKNYEALKAIDDNEEMSAAEKHCAICNMIFKDEPPHKPEDLLPEMIEELEEKEQERKKKKKSKGGDSWNKDQ